MTNEELEKRYYDFLGEDVIYEGGIPRQRVSSTYVTMLKSLPKLSFDVNACFKNGNRNVWLWSDTHFYHTNIIRYCNRPFNSIGEMNYGLLKNCLDRVGKDDVLIFGGDISLGHVEETNEILNQIPCYKINVLGNHDTKRKALYSLAVDETVAYLTLRCAGLDFFVSHIPVAERVMPEKWINMHGHIHDMKLDPVLGNGERHLSL